MTRILLDTHYLLWALRSPEILPKNIAEVIVDPASTICFSAASIWEIAIKSALGKDKFLLNPNDVLKVARKTGFSELAITSDVAARVALLPPHHKDPFDRLLVAQAIALPARLLTADSTLARYSELVWVEAVQR
jgi:PIN domain nuclease of toxin-antitoxin system